MQRGKFITFEGGEGAGKSTQIKRLATHLAALGLDVVITREPGGSPAAEAIRGLLLSGRAQPLGTLGEAYLFAAARIDHIAETIAPALERGAWVLCDRFADSTRVYQGVAGGLATETIEQLVTTAIGSRIPDLTLIIDLPVELGLARVASRQGQDRHDRFEADGVAIHEARRQGFLAIAAREPGRCAVIDGRGGRDEVAATIVRVVNERLAPATGESAP